MKTQLFRKGCSVLVSLTLMTTILAAGTVAQAPDGPGGFGGPPPGQEGGPPPGGFPGHSPFVAGTVSAVDAGAGTITITSQPGGSGGNASQVIKVNSDAQFVTQSEVAVADLKVGDQVQVQGVPTGITVSSLTVGPAPVGLPGNGGFGPGGPGGGAAAASSFATANGIIKAAATKADPHLTISLGADAQLFLRVAAGTKITRYATLKIADIKSGDRIMVSGRTATDGSLTASMVGINLPIPGGSGRPNGLAR